MNIPAALLAALLAACSGGSAPEPESPGDKKPYATESTDPDYSPPADCAAALDAIRAAAKKLDPIIEEQLDVFVPSVGRAAAPAKKGVVVTLNRGKMRIDGFPIDAAQLNQRLKGRVHFGVPLYIYAEGRAKAADVLAIVGAAPLNTEAHLIVSQREPLFPWSAVRPQPSARWANKMFDELESAPRDQRDVLETELMKTSLGTCQAALEVFAPVESSPASREARRLGSAVLDAVERCNCSGVEMAGLGLAVATMMSRWNPLGTVSLARTRAMRLSSATTVTNLALMLAANP